MEFDTLIQILADELQATLKPKRFLHVLGVVHTAAALAMRHGADPGRAALAALFHDLSKPVPPEQIEADLIRRGGGIHEDDRPFPAIWHGVHAAVRVREDFGLTDEHGVVEIIEAVRYHSTAEEGIGDLAKIIFLADAHEPGRDYEEIGPLRATARKSLDEGFHATLERKTRRLSGDKGPPSPRALRALKHVEKRRIQV